MARLNETERIKVLIGIGYDDEKRSYAQVVILFHDLNLDRELICKSTVSRSLHCFYETGGVKNKHAPGQQQLQM